MSSENRRTVESLMRAFEELVARAHQNRYAPEVVADVLFRCAITRAMEHHGIRGAAEMCRRLGLELERFANAVGGEHQSVDGSRPAA